MKELSVLEKAQRYDEVIERANSLLNSNQLGDAWIYKLLPELKESGGEKIKEKLIDTFNFYDPAMNSPYLLGIHRKDILAWLEKQGEQKPADRVEPKFHKGDWILLDKPCQIKSTDEHGNYIVKYWDDEEISTLSRKFCETYFHLWTIQDAKDGDVLVGGEQLFLFKKMNTSNSFYAHCNYHFIGYDSLSVYDCSYSIDNIYPATKEQRDLLFRKMKEAGYKWNAEKKELKKIEQEHIGWSEKDEKLWLAAKSLCYEVEDRDLACWIISLKDRVQPQPKQEWSEEDEYNLAWIVETLLGLDGDKEYTDSCKKMAKWLKYFRYQKQWKPSDEQITWLYRAADEASKYSRMKQILNELLSDLKKLMEE